MKGRLKSPPIFKSLFEPLCVVMIRSGYFPTRTEHTGMSHWEVTIEEKDGCFDEKGRLESKRCLFEVETIIV